MAQSTKLLSTAAHSIPSAPRYRAIFDDLKYRIGKGEYAIDKQLPSERRLMEEYHASRVTVRHALQQLQEEQQLDQPCQLPAEADILQEAAAPGGASENAIATSHATHAKHAAYDPKKKWRILLSRAENGLPLRTSRQALLLLCLFLLPATASLSVDYHVATVMSAF